MLEEEARFSFNTRHPLLGVYIAPWKCLVPEVEFRPQVTS
jgi:hypothetical protein